MDQDRMMDEQLQKKVADLTARNDETGDGKLDAADLKAQLNRLEAQLELQDQQNRRIMRNQRLRMMMSVAITLVLLVALGAFWYYSHTAYTQVMDATSHVNELAATLQASLDSVDPEALDSMMQDLPQITEQLKRIDVDALIPWAPGSGIWAPCSSPEKADKKPAGAQGTSCAPAGCVAVCVSAGDSSGNSGGFRSPRSRWRNVR